MPEWFTFQNILPWITITAFSLAVFRLLFDSQYQLWKSKRTIKSYKKRLDQINNEISVAKSYRDSLNEFLYAVLEIGAHSLILFLLFVTCYSLGLNRYIDAVTTPLIAPFPHTDFWLGITLMFIGHILCMGSLLRSIVMRTLIKNVRNPEHLAYEAGDLLNAAFEKKFITAEEREEKLKSLLEKEIFVEKQSIIKEYIDKQILKL